MKHSIYIFLLLFSCSTVEEVKRTRGLIMPEGMVVCAHPLASEAGLNVLREGGNAYDAAVATHFTLAVVYPRAGNIGGGGFLVYHTKEGKSGSLDFRERAPNKSHKDMYLDKEGYPIDSLSRYGALAAGVPGSVQGMVEIHKKLGTMEWKRLVEPAIKLAKEGFPITQDEANKLNKARKYFIQQNPEGSVWVKDSLWNAGDTLIQEGMARVLSKIAEEGRDGFYKGEVAEMIVNTITKRDGIMTMEDLASYKVTWRNPVSVDFEGYKMVSMPPPSSGGIAVAQLLKGSELKGLKNHAHNSAKYIHLMTELERRVYADRATYLGDPDFYAVPQDSLLSDDYIKARFSDIDMNVATPSSEIKSGSVEIIESFETTHYSIVDKDRNAASVTTTINSYYGSKLSVEGAGFFLNNEMDDFSAKPGVPNQFGLVGAEANAVQPQKRMLSSMTPTIMLKDGEVFMLTGSPGGATIMTAVYQSIVNVVYHGMTMQEAVNAKRTHAQWLPDRIILEEDAIPKETQVSLEALGHELKFIPYLGKVDAILVTPQKKLEGAADHLRGINDTALGH